MDINFPLILVTLTFATGFIWLADRLFFKARREAALKASGTESAGSSGTAGEEEEEYRDPYLVDLSRSFFPVLAIVLVLRSFLVEPFQIPSGSMRPTLKVGDFILVNKFAYGVRLPVLRNEVADFGDPERGDIMVFRFPKDGETNYIKRVVGLPGDRVRYRNHDLFINGEKVATDFVATLPPFELKHETLGDVRHDILVSIRETGRQGNGAWTIPEGEYFVMGDNRDNSNDSRFWGTVPDHFVVGKAFAIWMHWESLFSLPEFNRVGLID